MARHPTSLYPFYVCAESQWTEITKVGKHSWTYIIKYLLYSSINLANPPPPCFVLHRQKRMMGMTPNEAELFDVENHYPTDRIPMEMKEKSVAENLLDKMSETQ